MTIGPILSKITLISKDLKIILGAMQNIVKSSGKSILFSVIFFFFLVIPVSIIIIIFMETRESLSWSYWSPKTSNTYLPIAHFKKTKQATSGNGI